MLHHDHTLHTKTADHSELPSHLPGDEVLQLLYFLRVLRVFLHVLVVEKGLRNR